MFSGNEAARYWVVITRTSMLEKRYLEVAEYPDPTLSYGVSGL